MMIRILVMAAALMQMIGPGQASAQPVVRMVVETPQGRDIGLRCEEIWGQEGSALARDLLPAGSQPDTVHCLILETATFQERFGSAIPDWGVGLAFPSGRAVAIDYNRLPAVGRGVREVFLHEMVHALLFQGAGQTWLPTWFHEGCAMRYSGEWRFSDTVSLVMDGYVPNLDRLQGRFPASPMRADRAYRTSLLAVSRLQDKFGEDVPGRLVLAANGTGDFTTAFLEVTGVALDEFTADFASAMELRLGWLVMITRWPTLFVLMSLVLALGATMKILRSRRRLAEMEQEEEI